MQPVYFLPLITFTLSIIFSIQLYFHYHANKTKTYLLWWMIGVLTYGAGTFTESFNTLFGWHELNFRFWYVTGALLGGAPLAQGTVYLLLKRRTANLLTALFLVVFIVAAISVFLSPIYLNKVNPLKMSGDVFVWQWVRAFSPFINIYALVFLMGGAIYSAASYFGKKGSQKRFWGNVLIAIGALLPGIGGTSTRFGHVEVLYITELIGLILIFIAYVIMQSDRTASVHAAQQMAGA
ncbi:MAG: hypothetical protein H0W62_08155 [Chitinophagales bacterium]|nr:hypothetical protein [Chitinophagales bacterium]